MDYEDILNDALTLMGEKRLSDGDTIQYGPLTLTVAPKEGKANTLLADHLFSPALFFAERIERNLLDVQGKSVVELGAGAALPSLLLATLLTTKAPKLVVATDYPDQIILGNLKANVERNRYAFNSRCTVKYAGYEWGQDPTSILGSLPSGVEGFDVVIMSDILHFDSSHDDIITSIKHLLAKGPDSRVHISAGSYTHRRVCNSFVEKSKAAGLEVEEIDTSGSAKWLGTMKVGKLNKEDLAVRKSLCRYWIGRWL